MTPSKVSLASDIKEGSSDSSKDIKIECGEHDLDRGRDSLERRTMWVECPASSILSPET